MQFEVIARALAVDKASEKENRVVETETDKELEQVPVAERENVKRKIGDAELTDGEKDTLLRRSVKRIVAKRQRKG